MAGFSSLYINWKLAVENANTATRNLNLQFLNKASNAAAIAGVEPPECPIVDGHDKGYGGRIRDYDRSIDVTQRITKSAITWVNYAKVQDPKVWCQSNFTLIPKLDGYV